MRVENFIEYMRKRLRTHKGELIHYTETSITARVNALSRLEKHFNINIDDKCRNPEIAKNFLEEIRNANIEDLKHTPLSNAFRHYYKFLTGIYIGRIF